jgi:glycosyltransferase involved in cell wall biosynthesis
MKSPFEQILFVGPHYKNHRGGIGGVLEVYANHIKPFNYVPTLTYKNQFYELFVFGIALIKVFFRLLINRKIRIVHIHGAKDGSIVRKAVVCFIARKIFRKKVIFHIHAGAFDERYLQGSRLYRFLCRFLVNNTEAIVVLSNRWNDFFTSNFKIKRIAVIKNPVEKKLDSVHLNGKNGVTKFLFLGRIADHKGIFDLVNVFSDEQKTLRGKCKLYAGGNHEVERFKKAITDNNISDIVEYIGWTQGDEKAQHFLSCDYFILPTYEEAMPMTILEAYSYGKPVISTPVGSIPEILEHNYNGLMFEPGNIPGLKGVITEAINNPALKEQLSKNALKKASEFYPSAIKKELEKLYAAII